MNLPMNRRWWRQASRLPGAASCVFTVVAALVRARLKWVRLRSPGVSRTICRALTSAATVNKHAASCRPAGKPGSLAAEDGCRHGSGAKDAHGVRDVLSWLTPYPGTPWFRQLEAEGRLLHRDWSLHDTAHVVFQPKHMTPEELALGLLGGREAERLPAKPCPPGFETDGASTSHVDRSAPERA